MAKQASPIRWGIASAGKICNDFVVGLSTLDPKDHVVIAVAARDLAKAKDFAQTHSIPKFFGSYADLAGETEIDIVYIGVVNTEHKWIAQKMLEAGKHVLCEKPMCLNQQDTKELCELAKDKGRFLMEAIWSRCFPAYEELKRQVDAGSIGEVMQVNANLGFPISAVERVRSRDLGGGSILDLGVYVLQFQQLFFKDQAPLKMAAVGELNEEGVDDCASVVIKYPGGKMAVLSCNGRVLESNTAEVMGTTGFIKVPNFWCPTELILPTGTKTFEQLPKTELFLNFFNSTGLSYEAQEVRRCLLEGKLESPLMTHAESINLSYLRDEIRKQIGMTLPGDQ